MIAVKSKSSLISSLPVTQGSSSYRFYAQDVLSLPARKPGDVTLVRAICEVTALLTYQVMLGCYIAMGVPANPAIMPMPLSPPRTEDLDPGVMVVNGQSVVVTRGHDRVEEMALIMDSSLEAIGASLTQPEGWRVSFVLYAASAAALVGDALRVESSDYSEIWAMHFPADPPS